MAVEKEPTQGLSKGINAGEYCSMQQTRALQNAFSHVFQSCSLVPRYPVPRFPTIYFLTVQRFQSPLPDDAGAVSVLIISIWAITYEIKVTFYQEVWPDIPM